ncbi:MAG: hypothetical protein KDJ99_25645, partial [Candidatus Competibacteraceae bacterium]|nr:hypothetical protein [Candidatus Competibacteraceae bacterium]
MHNRALPFFCQSFIVHRKPFAWAAFLSLTILLSGCDQAVPPQQGASPSKQQTSQNAASPKSENRVVAPQTKDTMVLEIPAPWSVAVLKT